MNSKKILVTGAGGFVGLHLVKELISKKDYEVFANVYHKSKELVALLGEEHVIEGDLTDFATCENLIRTSQPQTIFHLAALSVVHNSVENAGLVMTQNSLLQLNILEAIRLHAHGARVVVISSANGYGKVDPKNVPIDESVPLQPLNPYAVSKISQEFLALQYHLAHGLDVVILRPFNHTGPGQTTNFVIPHLVKQFVEIIERKRSTAITVGNTESVRDFTDVRDMVKAYVLASTKCHAGEVYNIGSGIGVTVEEIISLLSSLTGVKVEVSVDQGSFRVSDVPILIADSTKFSRLTGYKPTIPLRQTLLDILKYMEA